MTNAKPIAVETQELCSYGCGNIAKFKNKTGKYICSNHHNSCPSVRLKNSKRIKSTYDMGRIAAKTSCAPWNKGLTKETDKRVYEISKKIAATTTGKKDNLTEAGRHSLSEKTRKRMIEQYSVGWEPTCGRCKKYDYNSPIAGKIKVDGSWELKVAKYLDAIGVIWERNKKRFPYTKPNGKNSTYQPDFYVKDWDTFIEVKGYETDLDKAKWSQFPNRLEVWKKNKIKTLEN